MCIIKMVVHIPPFSKTHPQLSVGAAYGNRRDFPERRDVPRDVAAGWPGSFQALFQ